MFKRGGSSFQAQGTGITSPYDTPRKKYKIGSWGEWEDQTRKLTQDPRGDFSYAAEGFSELGNPYKESGEAKMISEMLHAGAGVVRGSKEKASELEKKGELAILESQGGRMLTEEERAWKEAQTAKQHAHELQVAKEKGTYPDMHAGKIYDDVVGDWKKWVKDNEGRDGHKTVSGNVGAFADADMVVRNQKVKAYEEGKTSLAEAVPPGAFKDDNTINISALREGVVYYDPISRGWFTVHNIGTENETLTEAETYIDGWHNTQKAFTGTSTTGDTNNNTLKSTGTQKIDLVEKITTDLSNVEITDGVVMDEAAKAGIKLVTSADFPAHQKKTWQNYLDKDEMTFRQFKQMLQAKQTKDRTARQTHSRLGNRKITEDITVVKKAEGGRIGYDDGGLIDPTEELKLWWKESIENNEG